MNSRVVPCARFAALLCVFAGSSLAAQLPAPTATGTIVGRVTREGTVEPVRASLSVAAAGLRAFTEDDGRYVLRGVPAGRASLVVRALGYRPDTVALTVI